MISGRSRINDGSDIGLLIDELVEEKLDDLRKQLEKEKDDALEELREQHAAIVDDLEATIAELKEEIVSLKRFAEEVVD